MPAACPQPNPAERGGAKAAGSGVRLGAGGEIESGAGDAARWLGGAGEVRLVLEELAVPFLRSETRDVSVQQKSLANFQYIKTRIKPKILQQSTHFH